MRTPAAIFGLLVALTAAPAGASPDPGHDEQDRGSLAGRVTTTDGAPLEGVCVRARWVIDDESEFEAGSETDADGRWLVEVSAPATYVVLFDNCAAVDHVDQWYGDAQDDSDATRIEVAQGQHVDGIDAALRLGGTVLGRVTDALGRTLDGVHVRPERVGPPFVRTDTAFTDGEGRYVLRGVHEGEFIVEASLSDGAGGFHPAARDRRGATVIEVRSGEVTPGIDIELPAGRITGVIRGEEGGPIADARVTLWIDPEESSYSAGTDADGRYTFRALPAGTYRVQAFDNVFIYRPDTYLPQWYPAAESYGDAEPVEVTEPETVEGVDVTLPLGGAIEGRVVDDLGVPVAGVGLVFHGPTGRWAQTDEDGRYRAGGLEGGVYEHTFSDEGYLTMPTATFHVARGETVVHDVTASRRPLLHGRIRTPDGEERCGVARLFGPDDPWWNPTAIAVGFPGQDYIMRPDAVGEFSLTFGPCSRDDEVVGPLSPEIVRLDAGTVLRVDGELRWRETLLAGQVEAADGSPACSVVTAEDAAGDESYVGTFDGWFEFGVEPGSYRIAVRPCGWQGRAFGQRWFPGVTDRAEASVYEVVKGSQIMAGTISVPWCDPDSDGDGLSDCHEDAIGTDPSLADSDDDKLPDFEEVVGFIDDDEGEVTPTGTDPLDPDTDGDLFGDGLEWYGGSCFGAPMARSDPADARSTPLGEGPGIAFDELEPVCR